MRIKVYYYYVQCKISLLLHKDEMYYYTVSCFANKVTDLKHTDSQSLVNDRLFIYIFLKEFS